MPDRPYKVGVVSALVKSDYDVTTDQQVISRWRSNGILHPEFADLDSSGRQRVWKYMKATVPWAVVIARLLNAWPSGVTENDVARALRPLIDKTRDNPEAALEALISIAPNALRKLNDGEQRELPDFKTFETALRDWRPPAPPTTTSGAGTEGQAAAPAP